LAESLHDPTKRHPTLAAGVFFAFCLESVIESL